MRIGVAALALAALLLGCCCRRPCSMTVEAQAGGTLTVPAADGVLLRVADADGRQHYSGDGGEHWVSNDKGLAFSVGAPGADVYESRDGGATWRKRSPPARP